MAVKWHWIGDRLVERLSSDSQVANEWQLNDTPLAVKWHQIGSQVKVKWESILPLVLDLTCLHKMEYILRDIEKSVTQRAYYYLRPPLCRVMLTLARRLLVHWFH